ncbi:uncharacterized protein BX663DRAFT_556714 [Cokeromyces recurvatus]|uniref:uncharacterized protein n=1 Tax=Cokeromyces recurvatus TaxID=90255 RepID=UPI00222054B7|nr:uncharacterized protein BX663DRAFT_556714 [Cokeromyces recurvatus]KAI7897452.1 hypothetical protein BX663DRAFT_556714 [Cokeromyces recurvatus]
MSEEPSASTTEQPSTPTRGKRYRPFFTVKDFVSSEVITDEDTSSEITSSPSSFFPSDLMNIPVGYICRIEMCKLEWVPNSPLPIPNSHFADLVDGANNKANENQLFPTDYITRLYASSIFKTDNPFLVSEDKDDDDDTGLPSRIKSKGSEINLVASSVSTFWSPLFSAHDQVQTEFDATSWIFKQQDDSFDANLLPDIIFNYQQQEEVVAIGCGEIKKPGVSEALLNEDKMRVLEYEAVTFGVLVQGTTVMLLEIKMDLENGVYMYHEPQPFPLPTRHNAHTHLQIALEAIKKLKGQMLNSLPKVKCHDS